MGGAVTGNRTTLRPFLASRGYAPITPIAYVTVLRRSREKKRAQEQQLLDSTTLAQVS